MQDQEERALACWQPRFLWIPPILLAYAAVMNAVRWRKLRFWYDGDTLQVLGGVWGRAHTLLNLARVQYVVVKTSPYIRARSLATLVLHLARRNLRLPYIPLGQANALADLCLVGVEFESEQQDIRIRRNEFLRTKGWRGWFESLFFLSIIVRPRLR